LLIAALCLAFVVLTGSRAPLIALASIGIFVTIANKRWYYLIAAIIVSCLIIGLFWDRLSERGASLRPEIWRYVWMQYLDNPWLGIGLNRQPIAVPTATGIMYGAHNIFLAVLYQGGFIGLTLFLLMVVTVFFNSWALRSTSRLAALAALLQLYAIVALQFEAVSLCTRPTDTWLLLWLPLALYLYARRELNTRSLREMPCTAS
jgi:O-antigen ligase